MSDPPRTEGSGRAELLAETTRHALGWLVAGNALGLLLATLLLLPRLDALFTPWTYGRWMPLHLNLQLYGWCTLPLVALLFRPFLGKGTVPGLALMAVRGWSFSLGLGAASWLAGATTAKPFLDWRGPARWVFLAELVLLDVALAACWRHRRDVSRARWLAGWAGIGALLAVPAAMAVATRTDVYPPINPATGGPTGASLLGSTLAVVVLFLAAPAMLGVPRLRAPGRTAAALLAGHIAIYLALRHGDHSHREWTQILEVASLLIWPPLVARFLAAYRWTPEARRWLLAFGGWGVVLFLSACLTFLPGALDRLKFTNGLVGHAHLAMAGMATSFLMLTLVVLGEESGLAKALARPLAFWLWQVGTIVHVAAMLGVGVIEGGSPGLAARGGGVITAAYLLRWLAGAAMLAASLDWLARSLGPAARVDATARSSPGKGSTGPAAPRAGEVAA